jgi:hypothetical protein
VLVRSMIRGGGGRIDRTLNPWEHLDSCSLRDPRAEWAKIQCLRNCAAMALRLAGPADSKEGRAGVAETFYRSFKKEGGS